MDGRADCHALVSKGLDDEHDLHGICWSGCAWVRDARPPLQEIRTHACMSVALLSFTLETRPTSFAVYESRPLQASKGVCISGSSTGGSISGNSNGGMFSLAAHS